MGIGEYSLGLGESPSPFIRQRGVSRPRSGLATLSGVEASPRSGRAWACCSLSEAAPAAAEFFFYSFYRLLVKGLILAAILLFNYY
jgi:hypothetical protein